RYMAPEQARGHTDLRSDIFSAGAVFYELLVSRPPFVGEDPMAILEALRSQKVVPLRTYDPTIPIELDQVVERALEKDPARRFQTFHEMRRELEVIRRRVSGISEVMPEDEPRATPATSPRESPSPSTPGTARISPAIGGAGLEASSLAPQDRALELVASARERLERDEVASAAECLSAALELDSELPEALALKEQIQTRTGGMVHELHSSPRDTPLPTPGVDRIERYQVIKPVGRGPSGPVYRAWDLIHERMVALKMIGDGTVPQRDRLLRAAQAWLRLPQHPNVIHVYDVDDHGGRLCIAMEFLEGRQLTDVIGNRQNLSVDDRLALIVQVCEGLFHLHRNGVIHQDIRPSSIFILLDGQVKILDSGIARQAVPQDPELSRTRFLLDDYRAPEQARGRGEPRSDIYSVGKVLFELLTYRRAPQVHDPRAVRDQLAAVDPPLPTDLIGIVERALREKP